MIPPVCSAVARTPDERLMKRTATDEAPAMAGYSLQVKLAAASRGPVPLY